MELEETKVLKKGSYPLWEEVAREIADKYEAGEYEAGHLFTNEWIRERFGLEFPQFGTEKEIQQYQLQLMEARTGLRRTLLTEHYIALGTDHGKGLCILHPREQTEYAMEENDKQIKRALAKATELCVFTDHTKLDSLDQRKNADALSRLGALRAVSTRIRRKEIGQTINLKIENGKVKDEADK